MPEKRAKTLYSKKFVYSHSSMEESIFKNGLLGFENPNTSTAHPPNGIPNF